MSESPMTGGPADEVDFGFRRVPRDEKARLVGGVFDSVAPRYDLMNDLMSGGLHRLWKDALVRRLWPRAGESILDVAGGTGDVAFRILRRTGRDDGPDPTRITVVDRNAAMLRVGRSRAIDRGHLREIAWVGGDAAALPVPDAAADAYAIAFGIRNVVDIDAVLRDAYRVLRPGGRFLCLEFSRIAARFERAYDAYSFGVLPLVGRIVADDAEAYRYLAESIRRFPGQERFAAMIREAGFEQVSYRNLSGGIVAIHAGWRI